MNGKYVTVGLDWKYLLCFCNMKWSRACLSVPKCIKARSLYLETHQLVIGRVGVVVRVRLCNAHGYTVGKNSK